VDVWQRFFLFVQFALLVITRPDREVLAPVVPRLDSRAVLPRRWTPDGDPFGSGWRRYFGDRSLSGWIGTHGSVGGAFASTRNKAMELAGMRDFRFMTGIALPVAGHKRHQNHRHIHPPCCKLSTLSRSIVAKLRTGDSGIRVTPKSNQTDEAQAVGIAK